MALLRLSPQSSLGRLRHCAKSILLPRLASQAMVSFVRTTRFFPQKTQFLGPLRARFDFAGPRSAVVADVKLFLTQPVFDASALNLPKDQ